MKIAIIALAATLASVSSFAVAQSGGTSGGASGGTSSGSTGAVGGDNSTNGGQPPSMKNGNMTGGSTIAPTSGTTGTNGSTGTGAGAAGSGMSGSSTSGGVAK